MIEINEPKEEVTFKPKIIKKITCKKHGEHRVGLHLLESDEHICMLCVRDLVGTMEVEYEDS